MCQTYQIASSLKFPFAFSALPNLGVGGVHDGDQYVDHEDAHDDLVAQPNDDARGVGEFQGKVFAVMSELLHMNCFWTVCKQYPPDCGDKKASLSLEIRAVYQVVHRRAVLLILEWLEHGPSAHGMGTPDNQVDEGNAKDVAEHSSDADDDRTQVFHEEKTTHYPKIREVSRYQSEILEPEVGHEDSCGKEGFSDAEQAVSRDVGPVDVPVAVEALIGKCRPPTSQEEDLSDDVVDHPLRNVTLTQPDCQDLVPKKTDRKSNCHVIVPMAHSVFFSLVWILNDKKKRYEVEYLGPVVHDHSQHFDVNL